MRATATGPDQASADDPLRVFVACCGLGRVNRGFETFATELAAALVPLERLDVRLVAAAGPQCPGQVIVPSLSRNSRAARWLGGLIRNPSIEIPGVRSYMVEEISFALAMMPLVWHERPHVVVTSDPHLGGVLIKLRPLLPGRTRVLLSNGVPLPPPFPGWDHVQHARRDTFLATLADGAAPERHTHLPLGFTPSGVPLPSDDERRRLRIDLELPIDSPVVLSVGALNAFHKRMDYVIEEVAKIPPPRPHLVLLGDRSTGSAIERLASSELGPEGVTIRTVPRHEVVRYYDAADVFVLASLVEGFGLAYVEALARGLTCVAHDTEHTRSLFAGHGELVDLAVTGSGASALGRALAHPPTPEQRAARAQFAVSSFSWRDLAPRYQDMLIKTAQTPPWPARTPASRSRDD